MSTEIVLSKTALTIQEVVDQRELIKQAMANAMTPGVHFGIIPGCGDKPSLYQPGAQLMAYLFKLRPEYEVFEKNFDIDHREYRITCRIFSMASGYEIGQGVGICSTRESKYRFRNAAKEVTWLEEPVPGVYWTLKRKVKDASGKDAEARAQNDLDRWLSTVFQGKEVSHIGAKKDERGNWKFVEYHGGEGKIENENIADVVNTVLKISKKRAFVDAVITATASNDMFTQDLEDIAANLEHVEKTAPKPVEKDVTPKDEKANTSAAPETTSKKTDGDSSTHTANAAASSAPASTPGTTGWRDVIVHFGTVGGKVNGRKLGTLAKVSTDWLKKQMEKVVNPTKQDAILISALAMMDVELAKIPESNIGKSLELLRAKCEAKQISLASIVAANKELGSKAEAFVNIPDDEAKYLLETWEAIEKRAIEIGDNIPMV